MNDAKAASPEAAFWLWLVIGGQAVRGFIGQYSIRHHRTCCGGHGAAYTGDAEASQTLDSRDRSGNDSQRESAVSISN